ncbi:phage head closure protein [Chitiniphilus eburneus]|uniref:phage head closure protein n=1 Tax=Chitiniphilus eburneus TaxID=2571148 RepID=UPI0035CFDC85
MRSGKYRHRITLQRQVVTRSPQGEALTAWETAQLPDDTVLDAVPAEVLTGPGREPLVAGTKLAEATARISLRWFDGLDPAWRVLWQQRVYNITSIETDRTDRREYRLICTDGLSDGR